MAGPHKSRATADLSQVQQVPSGPNNGHTALAKRKMSGSRSDIVLHCLVLTLPMLLFSAALLGLVFRYRVTHDPSTAENDQLSIEADEPSVYYVELNSTLLVFIASWSSSLAPILVSSILVLMSYPAAQTVLVATRSSRTAELLTPYQLVLAVAIVSGGGLGSLWQWLKYQVGWRKTRQKQGYALTSIAATQVAATLLSFLVFLADTWLHVTTTSVQFTQASPPTRMPDYSLRLSPNCTSGNNSASANLDFDTYQACAVNPAATNIFMIKPEISLAVLGNLSSSITVATLDSSPPYVYLGVPHSQILAARDYSATSFAAKTECDFVSQECNLNAAFGASTPFWCNDVWNGDVQAENWQFMYFTDAKLNNNETADGIDNPFYFGWAAMINPEGGGTLRGGTSPELVNPIHGGTAFVMACNTTVYDLYYTSINGTITQFVVQASNNSVANIVQIVPSSIPDVVNPYLQQYASLATFSNTIREMADSMALAYSKAVMSMFSQSVVTAPALQCQEKTSLLVTRVPAAPLYALVVANLLFVIAGIVLTVLASTIPREEVKELQARLSIAGLVADRFERKHGKEAVGKVEQLFEESEGRRSIRIGVDKSSQGGYEYKVAEDDAAVEPHIELRRLI